MSGHVWNGSAWEQAKTMHVYNGTAWEQIAEAWCWTGTAWIQLYITPTSIVDDFNRANSTTIGGVGWTEYGTAASIVSNSLAWSGGSDGSGGVVTNGSINTDDGYVEVVLGGANAPNGTADASIVGRANLAGSAGIAANIFSDKCYLSALSGSLTSPSFTDFASNTSVSFSTGDTVRLEFEQNSFTLRKNGTSVLTASGTVNTGPSYRHGGLRVEHAFFNQFSSSFNSFKLADTGA
ncbi:hypothetical protein Mbo4_023 [Rhodococcus phage Mbo4]|uniref:Minor tail protein n=2 Tax=root TaxID=1 RepID=A0A9E7LH96_9CAUD|nr:hypothetical protein [Rhodococcus opacus]YP_010755928.1 hypothetical protein QEH50_gp23 [Rhodococcus phage Mbo4]EKT83030.1 hypothetical protein WSS_A08942 [Rhodococcus opacus M213]URG17513.1 hypothetical protein Mbo4_023 [Rhodococcus phage Mbo4]